MPFDFNLQSSLLLPSFLQGVLFFLLLIFREKKETRRSDTWLGLLLLLNSLKISFWMLGYAGWYDTHDGYTSFMFYFPFNNLIFIGPVLYFYFRSLSNTDFKITKQQYKHFVLPSLWILLMVLKFSVDFIFYYPFPDISKFQFGTKGPWAEFDKNNFIIAITFLSFLYYVFITLKEFQQYKIYVVENFSSIERISFSWLRNLLYAVAAGGVIMFIFFIIEFYNNGLTYFQSWYSYFLLGILIYYISINGYINYDSNKIKLQYLNKKETKITIVEESENLSEINSLKQDLIIYISEYQPYLNSELTLSELAKRLNTNSTYLSKLINEGFNQNFNDFVNSYRIYEFVKRIKNGEHKQQTLLVVAYDCGFNSKTTFNRAFKKLFLQTPMEYIRTHNL